MASFLKWGRSMTIGEAIRITDEMQPNSFREEQKIAWLRQLDMELYTEVVINHEGCEMVPDYDEDTDENTVLLVQGPYESIYIHWLQSRMDYALAEYGRYNNSNAAFEADRVAWRMYYNRTHMPLQEARGRYF